MGGGVGRREEEAEDEAEEGSKLCPYCIAEYWLCDPFYCKSGVWGVIWFGLGCFDLI